MCEIRQTPCGEIRGTKCQWEGVTAYKGIRYATAGRWEYPKLVTEWEGIYDATEYGHCSFQPRAFRNEEEMPKKVFYYNEFRKGNNYTYSEDCLFLNVFTWSDADENSNLPVLVYIHGGGYTGGSGHEKHFDGPVWAKKGVVSVTLNYRLGPLGYLSLPGLKEEAGHTGNYGLYDQMTALMWVKNNIRAFGGNPDKVTIMGQSAGAMSVQALCVSPLTDGLFHQAVMCSGGGVSKLMNSEKTPEDYYPFWEAVMQDAGCKTVAEFRALAPEKLFASWQKVKKEKKAGMLETSPCKDGVMLPEMPFAAAMAGKQKNIVYMTGATSEDMAPPVLLSMAKKWAELQQEQGKKPGYVWLFDRQLPGDNKGAWHSSDLWYWFGTLKNGWRPWEEKDVKLSDQMSSYLVNFVKGGNPNGAGLPYWEPAEKGKKEIMIMGEAEPHMAKPNMFKLVWNLFTKPSVGE